MVKVGGTPKKKNPGMKPRYSGADDTGVRDAEMEQLSFRALTDDFEREMRKRHEAKVAEGWAGWDDPEFLLVLERRLVEKVSRGLTSPKDLVDIANFAAFLWNFRIEQGVAKEPLDPAIEVAHMEEAEKLMRHGLSVVNQRIRNYKLDTIRKELGFEPGCIVRLAKNGEDKGEYFVETVFARDGIGGKGWRTAPEVKARKRKKDRSWGKVARRLYSWDGEIELLKSREQAEADGDVPAPVEQE